jgi:putative ABC transport system permease protein
MTGVRRVDDGPEFAFMEVGGILTYPISDDYFATIGAAVLSGRTFTASDALGAPPVAIINEIAQQRLFGGDALGHRIAVTHELTERTMATVVGVVADVRYGALEDPVQAAIYFSSRQVPRGYGTLLVRAVDDPLALASSVRSIVDELSPDLPLTNLTTLAATMSAATARTRVVLWLMGAFAISALVLSGLGLYALVSYSVLQRTREVGVRMALGADRPSVVTLVTSRPVFVVIAGTSVGVGVAMLLTRFMETLLYEVEPSDPLVLALSAALLASVAGVAGFLPALRATRVDPSVALRGE